MSLTSVPRQAAYGIRNDMTPPKRLPPAFLFPFAYLFVGWLINRPISAYFQFEAVKDRGDEVEVLVSRSGVRIVFPLWKDPKDEGKKGEEPDPTMELGLMFVYGRAGIRVRLEWTEVDGKRPGELYVSMRVPALVRGEDDR